MTERSDVMVTLAADGQRSTTRVSGRSWMRPTSPDRVYSGAIIVAGDPLEPFLACVVDILAGPSGRYIVHLDVVVTLDQAIAELRRAGLLPL